MVWVKAHFIRHGICIFYFLVTLHTVLFYCWGRKATEWPRACPECFSGHKLFPAYASYFNLSFLKSPWTLSCFSGVPSTPFQLNAVHFAIDDECAWILNYLPIPYVITVLYGGAFLSTHSVTPRASTLTVTAEQYESVLLCRLYRCLFLCCTYAARRKNPFTRLSRSKSVKPLFSRAIWGGRVGRACFRPSQIRDASESPAVSSGEGMLHFWCSAGQTVLNPHGPLNADGLSDMRASAWLSPAVLLWAALLADSAL